MSWDKMNTAARKAFAWALCTGKLPGGIHTTTRMRLRANCLIHWDDEAVRNVFPADRSDQAHQPTLAAHAAMLAAGWKVDLERSRKTSGIYYRSQAGERAVLLLWKAAPEAHLIEDAQGGHCWQPLGLAVAA